MTRDDDDPRVHLTFSQRHGYEPIPEPMKLEQISDDLRREIWNSVRQILFSVHDPYHSIFTQRGTQMIERILGRYLKISESRVSANFREVMHHMEKFCFELPFHELLSLLEFIINDQEVKGEYARSIGNLFELHRASYWLDMSRYPCQFIPRTSEEQGEATRQAIKAVEQSGIAPGATTHLRKAIEHLNAGRFAESITDSIHAV